MIGAMRAMRFGRYDLAAFLSFAAYAAGSVVVPVALVALATDLHFALDAGGMGAAGGLHLARTASMVASMLICGFAAGRWGKRRTTGVSVAIMCAGIGLCAVAPSYGILLLAMLVAGIGEGGIEGIATPFVAALHPEQPGRYINFAHSFWSVGIVITVLAAGWAISAGVSWRLAVATASAAGAVAAAMILLPRRRGRKYPEHPEPIGWRIVAEQGRRILATPRFWLYFAAMFVAGGGEFCLTFWTASYIQLNFVDAAWAGGAGTACFAAGMFAGRSAAGYWVDQQHLRRLILIAAIAGTVVTLWIPTLTNLWALFGVLFVAGLATAPFWPSVQSHAVDRLDRLDGTMLLVLLSCAGVPGCGVLTWVMGVIGDRFGLRAAFYLVPGCYLILAVLIAADRRRMAITAGRVGR